MKRFKRGFTLAEVLITLAIIGVVAAISIPSVISNSQQQEFKTGLRKAVSVLNSAITMNMAIDGESPYDNKDLFNYLQKHMSIIETLSKISDKFTVSCTSNSTSCGRSNAAFYTTDGMRFEFCYNCSGVSKYLYESKTKLCSGSTAPSFVDPNDPALCGGCGSYGLNNNIDGTTKPPCLITVDVNGDRKPNPNNVNCRGGIAGNANSCMKTNYYKYSDPMGLKLSDLFTIMITGKQAIPYGVAAQRAMYQAQAKK